MKTLVGILLFAIIGVMYIEYAESKRDPYQEGSHSNYRIECVNGFAFKVRRKAAMQVFNSDGTPLKCGKKIY